MESIFLKREDISHLKRLQSNPDFVLYRLDNDTLLKCFDVRSKTEEEKKEFLYTKGNKINYVSSYDMPENNFKSFVFVDGRLVGYTFDNVFKKGYRKLSLLDYKSSEKKIDILKMIKEHLEGLNDVGISYGNVIEENILYNPNKNRLLLTHMDDAKIKKYDFDVRNAYMTEFLKHDLKHPELLDHYMLNIFTIAYLGKVFYPSVLDYLETGKIPEALDNNYSKYITKEMLDIDNNYQGKLYIDNIKTSTRKRTK